MNTRLLLLSLFVVLIIFDVFSFLHVTSQLASLCSKDHGFTSDLNESEEGLQNKTMTENIIKNSDSGAMITIIELLVLCMLTLCNILGVVAVTKHRYELLIPWLVMYLPGIASCFIAEFIILATTDFDNISLYAFTPLCLGTIFLSIWCLVKKTFHDRKRKIKSSIKKETTGQESSVLQTEEESLV